MPRETCRHEKPEDPRPRSNGGSTRCPRGDTVHTHTVDPGHETPASSPHGRQAGRSRRCRPRRPAGGSPNLATAGGCSVDTVAASEVRSGHGYTTVLVRTGRRPAVGADEPFGTPPSTAGPRDPEAVFGPRVGGLGDREVGAVLPAAFPLSSCGPPATTSCTRDAAPAEHRAPAPSDRAPH